MKNIILLWLCFLAMFRLNAVPADSRLFKVLQKDSTYLMVCLHGDEHFHYATTADGMLIMRGADQFFYYAKAQGDSVWIGNMLAHNADVRSSEEADYVMRYKHSLMNKMLKRSTTVRQRYAEDKYATPHSLQTGERLNYVGNKKGLVILVNFANLSMKTPQPNVAFNRMFNEVGYAENGHIGSVHDYFVDQSYGKFNLVFDVVGPVTLSKNYEYYGSNDNLTSQTDVNVGQMVAEACRLVDTDVDYSQYDWDDDGVVEQVYIVYAGYGEAMGAPEETIWPHKGSLSSRVYRGDDEGAITLDGVKIEVYACSCELAGTSGNRLIGIGTACHEFSHCLGIPDFYDVSYKGGSAMQYWDIMDSGAYSGPNGNGEVPCGYSAYERWLVGWLDFEELTSMQRILGMECVGNVAKAYLIRNDHYADEYFTLENRQPDRWFSYVGQYTGMHGLLITHVDYNANSWKNNKVNTDVSHQRMAFVPADNSFGTLKNYASSKRYYLTEEEIKGDLFPGRNNVRAFDAASHLNVGGCFYHADTSGSNLINKPLSNIKEEDGKISFDFMGGIYVSAPYNLQAEVADEQTFTLKWNSPEAVDSFEIEATELRRMPMDSMVVNESFATMKLEDGAPDGRMDVSIYFDSYTQTKGWQGKYIYTSSKGAKVDGMRKGYMQTPWFMANSADATLKLQLSQPIGGNVRALLVTQQDDTVKSVIIPTDSATLVCHFDSLSNQAYAIRLVADSSFYVSSLALYRGYFIAEELTKRAMIEAMTKPTEKYCVTGITDYAYTITDVKSLHFQCRARAVKDEAYSEWSESIDVKLTNRTAIARLTDNANDKVVEYYDLQGRRIKSPSHGVYIMKQNGNVKKVVFKK